MILLLMLLLSIQANQSNNNEGYTVKPIVFSNCPVVLIFESDTSVKKIAITKKNGKVRFETGQNYFMDYCPARIIYDTMTLEQYNLSDKHFFYPDKEILRDTMGYRDTTIIKSKIFLIIDGKKFEVMLKEVN